MMDDGTAGAQLQRHYIDTTEACWVEQSSVRIALHVISDRLPSVEASLLHIDAMS